MLWRKLNTKNLTNRKINSSRVSNSFLQTLPGFQTLEELTIIILSIFLCFFAPSRLNAQNCFASVDLNRHIVYEQQPFKVTITVYTSTWYTAPLEFGNLEIPDAFILPFERTVPLVTKINNKTYAGITFYYIVFPYKVGSFAVPPIEVTAHTPPEGSSTSQTIKIKTPAKTFEVKSVPEKLKNKGAWFVAKDVSVQDQWSKPLNNLKVGDVVTRTITIDAKGTLPQFIPDITEEEKIDWASTYPQDAILKDTRDESDANGRSTETVKYLFEKEGDFNLPSVTIAWWNPYTNQQHVKSTAKKTIHIAANPNLGILSTIKDSLQATKKVTTVKKPEPIMILGMHWYTFAAYLLLGLLILYILIRWLTTLFRPIRTQYYHYISSEKYKFNQFLKSSYKPTNFLNKLYAWWGSRNEKGSPSISATLRSEKEDSLQSILKTYYADVYGKSEKTDEKSIANRIKTLMKQYRKQKTHTPTKDIISEEQQPRK